MSIPWTDTWLWWNANRFQNLFVKKLVGACLIATIYSVWCSRNLCYFEGVMPLPAVVMDRVGREIQTRCSNVVSSHILGKYGGWLSRGRIPFKYLGVSISPKRLSVNDCYCLVDKVVERIRSMGAKKLSYAGRVVLISSVLSHLHNYWARIFILPKTVLNKIEAVCRAYLWQGSGKPALVSWADICRDKKKWGLGFQRLHQWNVAALGKYVWLIEMKVDHLWVRWIHAIYLKGQEWEFYEPKHGTSWAWRKICWVKNQLRQFLFGQGSNVEYSINTGYSWLVDEGARVRWFPWVGSSLLIPRHAFMLWLVVQGRLLTQDRLMRMRICQENCCFLCGVDEESHDHLFFRCQYSLRCLYLVRDWLGIVLPATGIFDWWVRLRMRSLLQKQIVAMTVASLTYRLWMARNVCRVDRVLPTPGVLCSNVCNDVLLRLAVCDVAMSPSVRIWVQGLRGRTCY
ncbi:hypothetical protein RND81_11G045100 [Saponaria officinalis]|uniref:Reverse transcriptase zinc-binding domain-containing protein n=1 Tax=Saponaria officinalis TaxID=3572 RepID=A0AAW1HHV8_SAPOF